MFDHVEGREGHPYETDWVEDEDGNATFRPMEVISIEVIE